MSSYDLAVLVGRFQPWHKGHAALLARALASAPEVAIVIGSSFHAPTPRNPFSWEQRAAMITATLDDAQNARVRFVAMRDYYDDTRWSAAVRTAVGAPPGKRVALVGHLKDASSYYLRQFPGWSLLDEARTDCPDAAALRAHLWDGDPPGALRAWLPDPVLAWLEQWSATSACAEMRAEEQALRRYRAAWSAAPYPPIFTTLDSVVTCAGHVLLVQRGGYPGKGCWALPGGFLDQHERLLQGALRELREETGLDITQEHLRGVRVFDHPQRSQRGRTITHAHHFELNLPQLPTIAAADDAAAAAWVPIGALPAMEAQLFDDHFHILDTFLTCLPNST